MSLTLFVRTGVVVAVVAGLLAVVAPTDASHIDLEARRAAREAEREAKRLAEETTCTCKANLKFEKAQLMFGSEGLTFVPRLNIDIRGDGGTLAPDLNVNVNYEGSAEFAAKKGEFAVPSGVPFGGSEPVLSGAPCNGKYSFEGFALPPVSFAGVVRSLLEPKEELEGVVKLKASLVGCGFEEEENRQFSFIMKEFGNLKIEGWRSPR